MPKPRVYVETTIPSFYHDPRTSPAVLARRRWTRVWWASAGKGYELVTSKYVLDELAAGTQEWARHRVSLLDGVRILPSEPPVEGTVHIYIQQKLMPTEPPNDAWHLALASYHGCDLSVTWNCRHLANPNKAGPIERLNRLLGLHVPRLITPHDLLRRGR